MQSLVQPSYHISLFKGHVDIENVMGVAIASPTTAVVNTYQMGKCTLLASENCRIAQIQCIMVEGLGKPGIGKEQRPESPHFPSTNVSI